MRVLIPIISLILLRIVTEIAGIAKDLQSDIYQSYQVLSCGREAAYQQNLVAAAEYLQDRFPAALSYSISTDERGAACQAVRFRLYREFNPKLPQLYPNWVYQEVLDEA